MFLAIIFWIISVILAIPLSLMAENSFGYSFWSGFMQVINFLLGPLAVIFSYSIFRDLVKAKHD